VIRLSGYVVFVLGNRALLPNSTLRVLYCTVLVLVKYCLVAMPYSPTQQSWITSTTQYSTIQYCVVLYSFQVTVCLKRFLGNQQCIIIIIIIIIIMTV
jgi:hypothetical protein